MKGKTFTLVEVLITLTIVGVVSAITIPTLLTITNEKIKRHKIEVFENKLKSGLDLLNVNSGIGPYYKSSEEFVSALSKYLKIITICKSNKMKQCFPSGVIYNNISATPKQVEDYKTGNDLGQYNDDYNQWGEVIGIEKQKAAKLRFAAF